MSSRAGRRCPSFLDLARFEAGDLAEIPSAAINAHAGPCPRCGGTLYDIRDARADLLGPAACDHARTARRAARNIEGQRQLER